MTDQRYISGQNDPLPRAPILRPVVNAGRDEKEPLRGIAAALRYLDGVVRVLRTQTWRRSEPAA